MVAMIALVLLVQQGPDFPRLFPHPTGANGYEEYVRAADLLYSEGAFDKFQQRITNSISPVDPDQPDDSPKSDYLTTVSEESIFFGNVSDLVQQGNQKPVTEPHQDNPTGPDFHVLAKFKAIAKMQVNEAYFAFSEGRSSDGLRILGDTLEFAQNISQGSMIHRLVGIACESIALREIDRNLIRLSLADTRALQSLAQSILSKPTSCQAALANEEGFAIQQVTAMDDGGVEMSQSDPENDSDLTKLWSKLSLEQRRSGTAQLVEKVKAFYEQAQSIISGPENGWESFGEETAAKEEGGSIGEKLFVAAGLADTVRGLVLAEVKNRTKFHLLWLHGKILEYRWLHGTLPSSLSECAGPEGDQDVAFGGSLAYHVEGRAYTLESHGGKSTGQISLKMAYRPSAVAESGKNIP